MSSYQKALELARQTLPLDKEETMPGIAGIIGLEEHTIVDESVLSHVRRELTHDDCDSFRIITTPAGSGVIILDPGVNNMLSGVSYDDQAQVGVGFYGEFYGDTFQNVRNGDDVACSIGLLYKKYGEQFVHQIEGSFLVIIVDFRDRSFLIVNDHYASRPLFYSIQNGKLFIAPELKGIACLPEVHRPINKGAFISFLVNGHLLNDQTFYENISPLMPGSVIKISAGQVTFRRYYQYSLQGDATDLGEPFYIDALSSLLLNAVKKRLHNIEGLVIPVSGGYDSRGILGCVRQLASGKVRTVSWGIDERTPGADAMIGRQVAQYLGTDHYFMKRATSTFSDDLDEMMNRTDGLTDDPCFHHNELSIMKRIRFDLEAQYLMRGDECFGYGGQANNDIEALARIGVRGLDAYEVLEGLLNPLLLPEFRVAMTEEIRHLLRSCDVRNYNDRKDCFYFTQRLFHYLNRSSYYKMTVLDLQNPWLDKAILDFFKTVPWRYRIDKYLYRRTLETMYPDLYSIPVATSHSLENWGQIIRQDRELQRFIRFHLLENRNDFHEFLNINQLSHFISGCFTGTSKPSIKMRSIRTIKGILRGSPLLYRLLKSKLIGFVRAKEISEETVLFRLLIAKKWFDGYK